MIKPPLVTSSLTVESYFQIATTLVIWIQHYIIAQRRKAPFCQIVNRPWNQSSISFLVSHRYFQTKVALAILTYRAVHTGWVTILHHQSGWSEHRFVCTVAICNTEVKGCDFMKLNVKLARASKTVTFKKLKVLLAPHTAIITAFCLLMQCLFPPNISSFVFSQIQWVALLWP